VTRLELFRNRKAKRFYREGAKNAKKVIDLDYLDQGLKISYATEPLSNKWISQLKLYLRALNSP